MRDKIGGFDQTQAKKVLSEPETAAFTLLPDAVPPLKGRSADPVKTPQMEGRPAEPMQAPQHQGKPAEPVKDRPLDGSARPQQQPWIEKFPKMEDDLATILERRWGILGNPTTRKGDRIVAKTCIQIMNQEFPQLVGKVEHIGGATAQGEENGNRVKQLVIKKDGRTDLLGSSRPDVSFGIAENSELQAHINTVDYIWKDGQWVPTERESLSYGNLLENIGSAIARMMPKFLPSDDANEKSRTKYEESAKDVCRGIMEELKDKMIAHGMLPADGE